MQTKELCSTIIMYNLNLHLKEFVFSKNNNDNNNNNNNNDNNNNNKTDFITSRK